jgi:sigma-B regulation protein RsbU (phosphoserine phosphatase)
MGAIVIGTLGTVYFTGRVTAPIRRLNKDARKMASLLHLGNKSSRLSPHARSPYDQLAAKEGYSQDEVGELAAVFELLDRTTDELTEANNQLESRNQDLDDARSKLRKNLDRLELEMNAARKLQLSMVARDGEVMRFAPDVEAVGLMEPAREVGGDFYDIFNIDEHMVCFFIGDVSDKGTPSALLMSRTVSLVRFATLQMARLTGDIPTPSDILEQVNDELCKNNSTRMFVTLFLAIFDTRTGRLFCGNAGHVTPLVGIGPETIYLTKDLPDLPLGIRSGATYTTFGHDLQKGDCLTLFTDGVTEAENAKPEFFGTNRLLSVISELGEANPYDIVQTVRAAIENFVDGEEQFDDITMLVIGWEPMGTGKD